MLAGRLQAHKNNDLIVRIFNELDLPLHIVGTGRQEKFLKSIANDNIKFFGKISDIQLRDEYSGALGYIYPQVEDLGLMPLEAAACGTGTLAYARGGSLETIVDGVTGKLMHSRDVDDIKKTIINWDYKKYSVNHLRVHAEGFAKNNFILNFKNFLLKTEVYENSH